MVTAKLYVEGAGPRRAQQSQCRRAFAKFFEAAGVKNRPGVEPCGGRQEAFDAAFRVEAVPKQTVYETLEKATAECKHAYRKGDVSFDVLASMDPAKVEAACPHAKELLQRLRSL